MPDLADWGIHTDQIDPVGQTLGWLEACILGVLQGLTEFLPVSSSGHLALCKHTLGTDVPLFLDVLLHLGTLLSIVCFFGWEKWRQFTTNSAAVESLSRTQNTSIHFWAAEALRWTGRIGLACVPLVPVVLLMKYASALPSGIGATSPVLGLVQWVGNLRDHAHRLPAMVLIDLGITSILLLFTCRVQPGKVELQQISPWQVWWIGIAQALVALLPGLSRSGTTVCVGIWLGLRPTAAIQFSMCIGAPALLAAAALKFRDIPADWLTPNNIFWSLLATLLSTLVGWAGLGLLVRVAHRGNWWWFSLYLWLLIIGFSCYLVVC